MTNKPRASFAHVFGYQKRKALRAAHYSESVHGWTLQSCGACSGSGRYCGGACGLCGGKGKEWLPGPKATLKIKDEEKVTNG